MIIEFLYPDQANLFGELGDMDYLRQLFPEAQFVTTKLTDTPLFVREPVDLVFLAPMSERTQELVLDQLRPHTEAIRKAIQKRVHFLWLGNALEILGTYIENDDGTRIEGLGIFPIHAKRQMLKRLSSVFLGSCEGIEIVGAKAQFTQQFLDNPEFPTFCHVKRGLGLNQESDREGIHYRNFIGTSILGPFLILNPPFVEKWAADIAGRPVTLPFADLGYQAYEKRVKELRDPKTTL